MFTKLLISLCVFVLVACGGGSTTGAPAPLAQSEVTWSRHADAPGALGNYRAYVLTGTQLRAYSNFSGAPNETEAKLYEWQGTVAGVGNVRTVLNISGAYLRTLAVVRGPSGVCYALLRLEGTSPKAYGDGSYYPAFAKSDASCENWQLVKHHLWFGNSNSLTLTVDETAPATVNHATPRANRFTAVDDSFGHRLALAYSADGLAWYSVDKELYPDAAGGNPQFAVEVRTPYGYHLIAADWSDAQGAATRHVHLYSCDGAAYRVLSAAAPTYAGPKGTALAYDPSDSTVHAFTGAQHLSFKVAQLPCAL
jgi:hypothetical protein